MTLQIFCAWRSLKRAAEHGEILREDIDQPAVDRARSGDDAVARDLLLVHAEVGRNYARRTCHILRSCRDRAARDSRSRAVSRPLACCAAMRFSPPPSRASLAPLFELFDRGCHSADRPHLSQAARPSTRAFVGSIGRTGVCCSCTTAEFTLTWINVAEPQSPLGPFIPWATHNTEDKRKMLTRVGVPVESEAEPSAPDPQPTTLICFSHLRWNFVFQRPQHLMSRFARDMNVIYWEEPVEIGPRETAYLQVREAEDAPNVRIVVPHLPAGHARGCARGGAEAPARRASRVDPRAADRLVLHADDAALLAASRRRRDRLSTRWTSCRSSSSRRPSCSTSSRS